MAVTAVEQALEFQHWAALQVQVPVPEEQEGLLRRVLLVVLESLHRSIQEAVAAAQETVATPTLEAQEAFMAAVVVAVARLLLAALAPPVALDSPVSSSLLTPQS